MKLKSISIKNWKCFIDKKVEFEDGITSLKWPNGSGKSSLIEAIVFALFGKRPNGLDSDSLRNDLSEKCVIELKFEHNLSDFVVERSFGSSSSHMLYKDGELIARKAGDVDSYIDSIIPEYVVSSLWGYQSLADSSVLKTEYLFKLLESEFEESLALKKYFQSIRTVNQKQISSLEKIITNQNITQEDLDKIDSEIEEIEEKIKSRAYISDSEVVKAKNYEQKCNKYNELKKQLSGMSYVYDRNICVHLYNYKLNSSKEWKLYFDNVKSQLEIEKNKATQLHVLAKYPKNIIDSILKESTENKKCSVCGSTHFKPFKINYDKIDMSKISKLEKILEDGEKYNFKDFLTSVQYFQVKKQLEDLNYDEAYDWKAILESYNKETNELYNSLKVKKNKREQIKQDLAKLSDLLNYKKQYNDAKESIDIIDEYIESAKACHSDSLIKVASSILNSINSRYERIYVQDGIYKVIVNDTNYSKVSNLAVQALSKGEKTLVSLSLILAVRDLFVKNIPFIMDEAFANLDAYNVESVSRVLLADKSQWIVVSHDERLVL